MATSYRYRHRLTGIMGSLEVDERGEKMVRADEGWTSPICDWVRELSYRPVLLSQLAIAAYAADAAIAAMFTHRKPKDWSMLTDDEKSMFIRIGPVGLRSAGEQIPVRQKIFDFILKQLSACNEPEEKE